MSDTCKKLRAQGNNCIFISSKQEGDLINKIKKKNFEVNIVFEKKKKKKKNLKI